MRKEKAGEFVGVARSVCINNDQRAELKQKIDRLMNSDIGEVKSYA